MINEQTAVDPLLSSSSSEETMKHQMQFMQKQMQHMQHQSELAVDQIKLLHDQLTVETNARTDAQVCR